MQFAADTPPDTVALKSDLLKHRSAISDAQQQLDLNAFAGSMETPVLGGAAAKRSGVSFAGVPETPAAGAASTSQLASDILLHRNPALTGLAAVVGALLLAAAWVLLHGAHGLTLLTAVCYALLADLALNFLRSLISKQWQEAGGWAGSDWAAAAAQRASDGVAALAHLHDSYLLCRDPVLSLKLAAGLWGLSVLGSYLSIWSLAALGFVVAFTIPALYTKNREAVNNGYASAVRAVVARWDSLGLSRKAKALVLAVVLGCLWLRSSWATRLVALLVGALAVRCHLKPAEVERIIAIAEPYTQSVRKRASRMSMAAGDFMLRSVGGKTHAR